ncbi:polysaccharide biosynthesis protein, partial [Mesorhizobium sp. M4B.F.Ca.ET.169.01.1.1]
AKIFGLSTDVAQWSDVQAALAALQQSMKSQDKAASLTILADLDRTTKTRANAQHDAVPKTAGQAS